MRKLLMWLVIALFLTSIFQATFLIYTTNNIGSPNFIKAKATGQAQLNLCINAPPIIDTSNCSNNINQSTTIEDNTQYCRFLITNDNNQTNATWDYEPINYPGVLFEINDSGHVTMWGNHTGIGTYSTVIHFLDTSVCTSSNVTRNTTYEFTIWPINDPPYLITNIPSIQMPAGTTSSVFFLNNYFGDLEDTTLSYEVSGNSAISISINENTSEVSIFSPSTFCSTENIYFTAIDSGNLTADSNIVSVESICVQESISTSSGGGGGSRCIPEWQCRDWSRCLINGTRYRECIDLNGCDEYNLRRFFWEECEYVPTCFDGIKNQNEEDVDCGGPCPACFAEPTCFDGIKNGDEEDIDCGGATCKACPKIPATCFDGIKNQNETGIDCGGECDPCKEIQIPSSMDAPDSSLVRIAMIVGLSLIFLAMIYLVFKKEINNLIAKLGWLFTRKHKKQILLDEKEKTSLLKELTNIENKLALSKKEELKTNESLSLNLFKIARKVYSKALNMQQEFDKKELTEKLEKTILLKNFEESLKSYAYKIMYLETKSLNLSKIHFSLLIEELRLIIFEISKVKSSDYTFKAKEFPIEGSSLEIILRLSFGAIIALQYGEIEKAKNRYLKAWNQYESLKTSKKRILFADLERLYNHIKSIISWNK